MDVELILLGFMGILLIALGQGWAQYHLYRKRQVDSLEHTIELRDQEHDREVEHIQSRFRAESRRLEVELEQLRTDRKELLAMAMQLRKEGYRSSPEHHDSLWDGPTPGKYSMDEYERVDEEGRPLKDPETKALEDDVRAAVQAEL